LNDAIGLVLTTTLQTLEDLRNANLAAWLWDAARARIVWANTAGVLLFNGQSLFDLIDQPFDDAEQGIARIIELGGTLERGEVQTASLHFPSTGRNAPVDCVCTLHALADGRQGVLVVEQAVVVEAATNVFASAFAQLPMASVLLSQTGSVIHANVAASNLFQAENLAALLGDGTKAAALMQRLDQSSLVSAVETIVGKIGKREVRMNIRKLGADDGAHAVLMLDDITERRALERQMQGFAQPKPALAVEDAQTFESLSRTLKAATQAEPETEVESVAFDKPVSLPFVPQTIRDALEQTGAALFISQHAAPSFATEKAAKLLGHETALQLFNDKHFLSEALYMEENANEVEFKKPDGSKVKVLLTLTSIPWVGGPARQIQMSAIEPKVVVAPIDVEKLPTSKLDAAIVVLNELEFAPEVPPDLPPLDHRTVAVNDIHSNSESHATSDDLKDILDVAADGIITLDRDGKILSFSAAAEAIFGYRNAEVLQKPIVDFLQNDSRKLFQDYLAGLEGQGLATVFNDGREVNAEVQQGGVVPLFLTIGKLQNPHSKASYCAVVRDMTTWKRTEKELREAKEVAEEASRQKSDFLARISHELRTPLNAIIGFSEVMRLEQFGPIKNDKYRAYVNDIHASGGHLLSLINDLLDLSKIESGKMELNFTAVNIADATEHAMRLVQETATRGRVLVRKSFPEKMPRVVADLRAMRQVMLNLLANAVKFTDPGGQVIISAQIVKSGELTLRIKDTGIGMNAEQVKDALQPFKRIETEGRETLGTGLGLPLTKALVEANRAKFTLTSEAGQGTSIEITFPTTRVLAE
jgi:PAS domain S-box-containing protein